MKKAIIYGNKADVTAAMGKCDSIAPCDPYKPYTYFLTHPVDGRFALIADAAVEKALGKKAVTLKADWFPDPLNTNN